MKEDEKRFFLACFKYCRKLRTIDYPYRRHNEHLDPRTVINILSGYIPPKRCYYYLHKWTELGFYNYGVNLDLGWFYPENLPERYSNLLKEATDA